jgi:hypothetical protein
VSSARPMSQRDMLGRIWRDRGDAPDMERVIRGVGEARADRRGRCDSNRRRSKLVCGSHRVRSPARAGRALRGGAHRRMSKLPRISGARASQAPQARGLRGEAAAGQSHRPAPHR